MEWRLLLVYMYSTTKIIISTGATKLSVPGNVIQQITIGTVLHLKITGTSSNYVISMIGVHELTLYLDKTSPSNCCWSAVVNTTGVLNSCSTEQMRVSKNPFEMKVQPQNKTCSENTRLNIEINSKRCPGIVFQENDKNWYSPGSKVTGNCKVDNRSGRENFTCNSEGIWRSIGKCYVFTDTIPKPTTTSINTNPHSTVESEQLTPTTTEPIQQTSVVTLKTSTFPQQSEFSTKISILSTISTSASRGNDTYMFVTNNTRSVGTSHQNTVEYIINQSTPWEYFGSFSFSQSRYFGSEIQGSFSTGNIDTTNYFHNEALFTSPDQHVISATSFELDNSTAAYRHSEALFTSLDQHSISATSFEFDISTAAYPHSEELFTSFDQHSIFDTSFELVNPSMNLNSSDIFEISAVPDSRSSTINTTYQYVMPKLTSGFTQQAVMNESKLMHNAFGTNISILTAEVDQTGRTLSSFVEVAKASKFYNRNLSTGISVDIFGNHTLTNSNNHLTPKKSETEPPNSDVALAVTIVLFVGIVLVLLTMIFRVVWKTRNKNESQQGVQGRKFADVAPLAQFRESIESHHVFGENRSYIDLGDVNESNTDDDVSSPGNSESSSRGEEVNKDGRDCQSDGMTSSITCNTKLKTFSVYNNKQNNSHRHNYNQKVGVCNSLKKSVTQKEIKHTGSQSGDVYALSYKHRSRCYQPEDTLK